MGIKLYFTQIMSSLLRKILVVSLLGTFLIGMGIPAVWAEDSEETIKIEEVVEPAAPVISDAVRNAYLMIKLQQYLQQSERNYNSLQEKMDLTKGEIDENRYTIDTLDGQVNQLDKLIVETDDKIKSVQTQIAEKEQEIRNSLETIEFSRVQIDGQKEAVGSYIRLIYFEKNLNSSSNMQTNFLKMFFRTGTVSTTLQNSTFLGMLEKQAENLIDGLQSLERQQKKENYDITLKQQQLDELNKDLEEEYRNLTAQLEGKQNFLNETEGSDEIYRELFASYKAAQEAILEEINLFQTNISALEDRLAEYQDTITAEELAAIDQIRVDSEDATGIHDASNFLDLDWPVSPELGLTAYFDDEKYVELFGASHHAMDVRIAHGSIIYAPADAVVYRVNDAAKLDDETAKLGYGYIILAHRKGTMTLYGHISGALVQEGDYVHRGQMIGLTGGTPGTPGAGARTTGAHLHMEVIQDGIRVDPLEYLPLTEVPTDSLLEQYLPLLQQQIQEELDAIAEAEAVAEETEAEVAQEEDPWGDRDEGLAIPILIEDLTPEQEADFWTQGEN